MDAITQVPTPANEPVHDYAPQSPERTRLAAELAALAEHPIDLPHVIGGKHRMGDGERIDVVQPHRHAAKLGTLTNAVHADATAAIEAAMAAKKPPGRQCRSTNAPRCSCGPPICWPGRGGKRSPPRRCSVNPKSVYQAEIDAPCELIDFWRFNVAFARQILAQQPISGPGEWNRSDYRPLDGFVYAITPFNFTSIAGNLPTAPALMGNTVVWKPSITQTLSAYLLMQLLEAAGLPPGVINMVTGDGFAVSDVALADRRLAGIHFTGSTATFQRLWYQVGTNIGRYHSYPRLVGETGGKDFVVAHASAHPDVLRTALIRGAFDYQGQKCSAASRAFIAAFGVAADGRQLPGRGRGAALRRHHRPDQLRWCTDRPARLRQERRRHRAGERRGRRHHCGGRRIRRQRRLFRASDRVAVRRPDRRVVRDRVLRPAAVGACLSRRSVRADPRRHRHRIALRA